MITMTRIQGPKMGYRNLEKPVIQMGQSSPVAPPTVTGEPGFKPAEASAAVWPWVAGAVAVTGLLYYVYTNKK